MLDLLSCEVVSLYPAELLPFLVVVQNDDVIISPRTAGHCLPQLIPSTLQSLVPPSVFVIY